MTNSSSLISQLWTFAYGPMNLLKMSASLSLVAFVSVGPLLLFAQQTVVSQKEFERLAASSFPSVISFIDGVPKDKPCPDSPSSGTGCFLFNGFVAREDGNKVDVTFRWMNGKGGPVVVEPVMTVITDDHFEFAPNVDPVRMRVRIFSALREVVSKTSPMANLIYMDQR